MRAITVSFLFLAVTACSSGVVTGVPSFPSHSHSSVATATPSPGQSALNQVSDPRQVTGKITGPCHTSDNGMLPDPRCTPGAYDPAITAAKLCAPGYTTRDYRPPVDETEKAKRIIEQAYGQSQDQHGELDHLISLELGGANDLSNLWEEVGPIPNDKDTVENTLHRWVCETTGAAAETRLHLAQTAIARNWQTALSDLDVSV